MAVQDATGVVDPYNYDAFSRSETANKSSEFKSNPRAGPKAWEDYRGVYPGAK